MVKLCVEPVHVPPALVYVGVTINVDVTVLAVLFAPANEAMFPVPLAAKPIDVVLFVQS